jgi:hypothetical protein
MMEKIHAQAKMAAYAGLTPAHAASVNALAAKVAAGTLSPREAAQQIDDLLTADEDKSVGIAARKSFEAMHAAMADAGMMPMGGPMMHGGPDGPPAGGPPPGGPGGQGGPPPMGPHHGFGRPSSGRYLLMVSLTPEQMRKAMPPRARSTAAP